jgi:hypothetical protein
MHKAIGYLLKDYCGEWYNPQRLPSISTVSLQKVPKPHHFPSPRSNPGIVAAQTSTLTGIAARRSNPECPL